MKTRCTCSSSCANVSNSVRPFTVEKPKANPSKSQPLTPTVREVRCLSAAHVVDGDVAADGCANDLLVTLREVGRNLVGWCSDDATADVCHPAHYPFRANRLLWETNTVCANRET